MPSYPTFIRNHGLVDFLCPTKKIQNRFEEKLDILDKKWALSTSVEFKIDQMIILEEVSVTQSLAARVSPQGTASVSASRNGEWSRIGGSRRALRALWRDPLFLVERPATSSPCAATALLPAVSLMSLPKMGLGRGCSFAQTQTGLEEA